MIEYAYALYDGNTLAVFDFKPRIFWQRSVAKDNCPQGFTVRKIKISPVYNPDSKVGD